MNLDRIDLKILEILQNDGRISISALADKVGLSKTPCQTRFKRLVDSGAIAGFRAVVDHAALKRNCIAFTEVRLSNTHESALKAFDAAVRAIPEIEQCHMIAGPFDYLLKVRTTDIGGYRRALGEHICNLPFVLSTSTHIVMDVVKE